MAFFAVTMESSFPPCPWGELMPADSDTIRVLGFNPTPFVADADTTSTVQHAPSAPLVRYIDNDDTAGFSAELGRRAWKHRAHEE